MIANLVEAKDIDPEIHSLKIPGLNFAVSLDLTRTELDGRVTLVTHGGVEISSQPDRKFWVVTS